MQQSHEWDNLPIAMIKICGVGIVEPLRLTYNQCLATGTKIWKNGNVIPVQKKGSRLLKKNECHIIYTILQNKRMRWCGVPHPPPIISERFKLPQQIIHRRKGNLSETPNQFKYRKNILILRFYERFSRNG